MLEFLFGTALLLIIRYSESLLSKWTAKKQWRFFPVQMSGACYIIGTGVIMFFIPSPSNFLHVLSIAVIVAGLLKFFFILSLYIIKLVKFDKFLELKERFEIKTTR